jgi:hypothetical protein
VDPEPAIPDFIDAMILCSGEVPPQIPSQGSTVRLLGKLPVEHLFNKNADFPTLLGHIEANIHVLTAEIYLCTFHGKPPFGIGTLFPDTTIYLLKVRLTS